jgi:hypothetical protein
MEPMSDHAASSSAATSCWRPVPPEQVEQWNHRLLRTTASVYQFPYWNEPYRRIGLSPTYVVYGPDDALLDYACVLSLNLPGIRIGLVVRGPVRLQERIGGTRAPVDCRGLAGWARSAGYIFLRITHPDPGFLETIASAGEAVAVDAFPWFRDLGSEAIVDLDRDEDTMLASFSKSVRKELQWAVDAGWEVEGADDESAFATAWPLFTAHAKRKGFSYGRPLAVWLDTIRRARGLQCVRTYMARRNGEPGAAALIYRDGATAYGISAFDPQAVKNGSSPACLLHWTAMREFRHLGCTRYSLGAPHVAQQFKEKFHPRKAIYPSPVTLVANRALYRLWPLRAVRRLQPHFRRLKGIVARCAR